VLTNAFWFIHKYVDIRYRSWLSNYATSRKVAGSRPYDVNDFFFFNLPNYSSHTRFWVYSACNSSKHQKQKKMFLGVERGQCVVHILPRWRTVCMKHNFVPFFEIQIVTTHIVIFLFRMVEALCYKPEGRAGSKAPWGQWFSSIDLIVPTALGSGVYSACNT
jgi:hypothetical protein